MTALHPTYLRLVDPHDDREYQNALANGLCLVCCEDAARPNRETCAACDKCVNCGAVGTVDDKHCPPCDETACGRCGALGSCDCIRDYDAADAEDAYAAGRGR